MRYNSVDIAFPLLFIFMVVSLCGALYLSLNAKAKCVEKGYIHGEYLIGTGIVCYEGTAFDTLKKDTHD